MKWIIAPEWGIGPACARSVVAVAIADRFAVCKLVLHLKRQDRVSQGCEHAGRLFENPLSLSWVPASSSKIMWVKPGRRIFSHGFQPEGDEAHPFADRNTQ